jgi:hypothetical protein
VRLNEHDRIAPSANPTSTPGANHRIEAASLSYPDIGIRILRQIVRWPDARRAE